MWKSVFWNEDNYRPDVVSSELNDQYDKLDTESKQVVKDSLSNSSSGPFGIQTTISVGHSNSNSKQTEDFLRALKEKSLNVRWEGECFLPKLMSLSQISLANFRDEKSFQDRRITVRYFPAFLYFSIKIVEDDSGIPVIVKILRSNVVLAKNLFDTCKNAMDDEFVYGKQLETQFLKKLRHRNEEPFKKVVGAFQEIEKSLFMNCYVTDSLIL